jgi:phage regulator Rha-like protein
VEMAKFAELEGKLRSILNEYSLVKKRNQEVEESIKKIELELEGAKNRIRELNEEKDVVSAKVDSLLELLQDIEVVE